LKILALLLCLAVLTACTAPNEPDKTDYTALGERFFDMTAEYDGIVFRYTRAPDRTELCYDAPSGVEGMKLTVRGSDIEVEYAGISDTVDLASLEYDHPVRMLSELIASASTGSAVMNDNGETISIVTDCGKIVMRDNIPVSGEYRGTVFEFYDFSEIRFEQNG